MKRGDFSLLATESLDSRFTILSQTPVMGKACFDFVKASVFVGDDVFEQAVHNALAQHEGATVLVKASFIDTGSCVEVHGLPATF